MELMSSYANRTLLFHVQEITPASMAKVCSQWRIVSYKYISCSGSITYVGKLSFTCYYIMSFRRDFLFLLLFGIGCINLL